MTNNNNHHSKVWLLRTALLLLGLYLMVFWQIVISLQAPQQVYQDGPEQRGKGARVLFRKNQVESEEDLAESEEETAESEDGANSTPAEVISEENQAPPKSNAAAAAAAAENDVLTTLPPISASNTAISVIAMGPAASQESPTKTLAHRLVCSIRARGNYRGPIIVLTDAPEEQADWYRQTLNKYWAPVYVIIGKPEHLYPKRISPKTNLAEDMPFARRATVFKRFKTYLLDYLDYDPRLQSVEYNLYLDIDSLVGKDLNLFFQEKHRELTDGKMQVPVGTSFVTVVKDKGVNGLFHGGMMLVYRRYSEACLRTWRNLLDKEHETVLFDQKYFLQTPNRSFAETGHPSV